MYVYIYIYEPATDSGPTSAEWSSKNTRARSMRSCKHLLVFASDFHSLCSILIRRLRAGLPLNARFSSAD